MSFKLGCKLLPALLLALLAGCASRFPYHGELAPLPRGPICQVAVLPFVSESEFPLAGVIAHKVFTAELQQATNYLVIQEGDIIKLYQQLRILPGRAPDPEQLLLLASRLRTQLLISGRVMEMRENPATSGVNPVLALEVHILDGATTLPLWSTYHLRQGVDYRKAMHFGAINTATGLTQQVSREIINLWFKKGLSQCDVTPQF